MRITVNPPELRSSAQQLKGAHSQLGAINTRLAGSLSGLDWDATEKAIVTRNMSVVRDMSAKLGDEALRLAQYLTGKADAFDEAERRSMDGLETVIKAYNEPVPVPTPTPTSVTTPGGPTAAPDLPKDVVDRLERVLMPIDWVDKLGAEKEFRQGMEEIGRIMNHVEQTRGYIQQFHQVSDFLLGADKAVGAVGNVLTLNDFRRYMAGDITNQEVAHTAISVLLGPVALVPGVGDKIVNWYASSVPDPSGHWHGLVGTVE